MLFSQTNPFVLQLTTIMDDFLTFCQIPREIAWLWNSKFSKVVECVHGNILWEALWSKEFKPLCLHDCCASQPLRALVVTKISFLNIGLRMKTMVFELAIFLSLSIKSSKCLDYSCFSANEGHSRKSRNLKCKLEINTWNWNLKLKLEVEILKVLARLNWCQQNIMPNHILILPLTFF